MVCLWSRKPALPLSKGWSFDSTILLQKLLIAARWTPLEGQMTGGQVADKWVNGKPALC